MTSFIQFLESHPAIRHLVEIKQMPADDFSRNRAYLLRILLLLLSLITTVNFLIRLPFGNIPIIFIVAMIFCVLLYVSNRYLNYGQSAILVVITGVILPYLVLFLAPMEMDILLLFFFAGVPLLISAIFLSPRATFLTGAFVTATIFGLNTILGASIYDSLEYLTAIAVFIACFIVQAWLNDRDKKYLTSIAENVNNQRNNFFTILNGLPDAVVVVEESTITYANRRAGIFLNVHPVDDLVGQRIGEYFDSDRTENLHVISGTPSLTVRYETNLRNSDPSRDVEITTVSISLDGRIGNLLILRDTVPVVKVKPPEKLPAPAITNEQDSFALLADLLSEYAYCIKFDAQQKPTFDWVKGSIESTTGYSPQAIMQMAGWDALIFAEDRNLYRQHFESLKRGESHTLEYRLLRADHSVAWVVDHARPVFDDDGRVIGIIGAASDVTERVDAQDALTSHIVQQAVVAELGLLALSYDDQTLLLRHAVVLIEQVLEVTYCGIVEYVPADNLFYMRASTDPDHSIPIGGYFSADREKSQAGYALTMLEPIITHSIEAETRFEPLHYDFAKTMKSNISVVIHGTAAPYGVLMIYCDYEFDFTDDDVYFLQSIANVLGAFIERNHAQTAERVEREFAVALRDATTIINTDLTLPEVLKRILQSLSHVVSEYSKASIMLVNVAETHYRIVTSDGFEPDIHGALENEYSTDLMPLLGIMINTLKPLRITDVRLNPQWHVIPGEENVRSYLGAPIAVQGRCIGFIHLNSNQVGTFSERDADRLHTFAEKIGNAIVNARHAEELENMVKMRTLELQREQEQLEAILGSSAEGIFYTENNQILFANDALARVSGYAISELMGKHPRTFFPPDLTREDQQAILYDILNTLMRGEVWRSDLPLARKDGVSFSAGLTISRVGSVNNPLRAVTIMRDISREKELDAIKERFIANAAHELRSPIANLNTRMYLIRRQPEKIAEHLDQLAYVVSRMNRLVSDLLDMAYIEHGRINLRRESIILQHLATSVVTVLTAEAEINQQHLSLEAPDDPIELIADSHRLEQVMMNLVNNALHYTSTGGAIKLICKKDDTHAVFAIQDTGTGIAQEDIEHIFRPFYRVEKTSEKKGTGLGLSITRDIVELHGGTIHVESQLGVGSTFIVRIPLEPPTA